MLFPTILYFLLFALGHRVINDKSGAALNAMWVWAVPIDMPASAPYLIVSTHCGCLAPRLPAATAIGHRPRPYRNGHTATAISAGSFFYLNLVLTLLLILYNRKRGTLLPIFYLWGDRERNFPHPSPRRVLVASLSIEARVR